MTSQTRPLSPSERQELESIVSTSAHVLRAVLWMLIVFGVSMVTFRLNQKTGGLTWWPYPAALTGILIWMLGSRMSGGRALRRKVQADITAGEAEERVFAVADGIIFPEIEDEGPVVFILSSGRVFCLSGQHVSRLVSGNAIASELVESIAPISKQWLGLKCIGKKCPIKKAAMPFFQSSVFDPALLRPCIAESKQSWTELLTSAAASPIDDRRTTDG